MIDMHAHWRPAELIDALRARTKEPRIARNQDGVEMLKSRNGTLDMQASLSSVMVTLCLTDYLAPYPDAMVLVHNLGGNIPYEIERMDHRSLLDTANEELPSSRFRDRKSTR